MNIFDISRKCSRHLQDDAFPDNRSFFLFLFSPKAGWYVFVNRIILHSVKKWQVVRAYSFENPKSTGTLAIVSIYFLNIIICWSWNVNVSIKLFVFFFSFSWYTCGKTCSTIHLALYWEGPDQSIEWASALFVVHFLIALL